MQCSIGQCSVVKFSDGSSMQSCTMYFSKVQISLMYVSLVQGNSIQFRANYNAVKHLLVEETLSLLMCSCSVGQVKLVCGNYVIE